MGDTDQQPKFFFNSSVSGDPDEVQSPDHFEEGEHIKGEVIHCTNPMINAGLRWVYTIRCNDGRQAQVFAGAGWPVGTKVEGDITTQPNSGLPEEGKIFFTGHPLVTPPAAKPVQRP